MTKDKKRIQLDMWDLRYLEKNSGDPPGVSRPAQNSDKPPPLEPDSQSGLKTGLPRPAPGREKTVYSVKQIVGKAASLLEAEFSRIWVEGEVSNFQKSSAGHLYFTLKEETAQLSVVLFRSAAKNIKSSPENGDRIRCRGRLSIYAPGGRFQLVADWVEPAGLGELLAAMERLKKALAAEGLFDRDRKKPLPPYPRVIGVVTSPTGAAIRDIQQVLWRRWPVRLVLSPTPVQGEDAPRKIVSALKSLEKMQGIDLIIIGRGGGSTEDLAAFSSEAVVRAVAACKIPIISAVGHEVDFSLSDSAADKTAPTPSAAAELAVPRLDKVQEDLSKLGRTLARQIKSRIKQANLQLSRSSQRLREPTRGLADARQYLDSLNRTMSNAVFAVLSSKRKYHRELSDVLRTSHPSHRLKTRKQNLEALTKRLLTPPKTKLQSSEKDLEKVKTRLFKKASSIPHCARTRIVEARGKLQSLNPLSVLERGYSLVLDKEGRVLSDSRKTEPGETVNVKLHKGDLECKVQKTRLSE